MTTADWFGWTGLALCASGAAVLFRSVHSTDREGRAVVPLFMAGMALLGIAAYLQP